MLNKPVIQRRKVETVFLGSINQVVDGSSTRNSTIECQVEETIRPNSLLETDNNPCEIQAGTSVNSFVNNTPVKSDNATESELRCSLMDSTGEYSMDSDFFAIHKLRTIFFIKLVLNNCLLSW